MAGFLLQGGMSPSDLIQVKEQTKKSQKYRGGRKKKENH